MPGLLLSRVPDPSSEYLALFTRPGLARAGQSTLHKCTVAANPRAPGRDQLSAPAAAAGTHTGTKSPSESV